jgi:2-polyprenyl-3-methyl-5-hydroxy-6-metoxy-1,4-benzoquinol methylase
MEAESFNPIRADRFLEAIRSSLAPAKGSFIYDACVKNYVEKTNLHDSSGYARWLRHLLPYLVERGDLSGNKTLDLGCGTGELTVLIKLLGFDAIGLDVDPDNIRLAKLLANENRFSDEMFICNDTERLPFADKTFDIVTMISVLEHLDEYALATLVPELARICRGVVFVQAPNKRSVNDDHTGLKFVPWMPHWLAKRYVAVRGDKYKYSISASGSWDVHYRSLEEAVARFAVHFDYGFLPPVCCYPEPSESQSLTKIGKRVQILSKEVFVGIPLPWRNIQMKLGRPREAYYPYLNLVFTPKGITGGALEN